MVRVPCTTGEKKSYKSAEHSNGRRWGATTDPAEIQHDFKKWPKANIGLPTGPDNGFFVVEADTPEGHDVDGIASLRALEAKHGPLPATLMAESPSGSLHHYFKWPGALIRNSGSKVGLGIDVLGEGGMVLAPPSVMPKGTYKWLNDNAIADAPEWLIKLATAGDSIEVHASSGEPQSDPALIAAAMAVIPNEDVSQTEYNRIGMACWRATGGNDEGFKAFDTWARKSKKYGTSKKGNGSTERWNHYIDSPPSRIGAGTIFHLANQAAPGWSDGFYAELEAHINDLGVDYDPPQVIGVLVTPITNEPRKSAEDGSPLPLHWHGEPWSIDSQWLIKGLIPETGAGLLSGQWGMAKTFTALDLAASVMTDQPFAGRKVMRRGGVLFIAAEGSGQIKKRLTALAEHKSHLEQQTFPFVWIQESPRLLAQNAKAILIDTATAATKQLQEKFGLPLVLIVVDTLAAAAGFQDENSAAQGQHALNVLHALSLATGAVALAVDHFGKAEESGTRGTSAKEASADFVLALLGRRDLNGTIDDLRMAVRKVRDGTNGYEIPFKLKEVNLGTDRDGDPVTTCIVEWGEMGDYQPRAKQPSRSLVDLNKALTAALNQHGEQTTHEGRSIKVVRRAHLLGEFKKVYRGESKGAPQAFRRALEGAGDDIAIFEVEGEQFIGPLPEKM